jgi:aspartyl-tRNA(Asn)/glutamyl-tRNA(Gln) amidotransferase subunit B
MAPTPPQTPAAVRSARLVVGMEIHVELATRSKVFTRAPNPAAPGADEPPPNTLIDPVVLGLPGALPVLNRAAVELSVRVGLALGCSIGAVSRWDRKSYFYPDLPKGYQISQYDLPLCLDGSVDVPAGDGSDDTRRIGIVRAHLEEDAGKLLHELPGGGRIDHSIVDLNRAGAPLLEIVTAPDLASADDAVAFAQALRNICRAVGASQGVMQKGHMRFEPNINTVLTLADGRTITTPIVEIKNLNSFRALHAAIEHERREQPERWALDGRVHGPGTKTTRGWDDAREVTFLQREKEDEHDYRYFPDPDLPPLEIDPAWVESIRATLPELPHVRARRYEDELGLAPKEARALADEPPVSDLLEAARAALDALVPDAVARERAEKVAANLVLQSMYKLANERGVGAHELGVAAAQLAGIAALRAGDEVNAAAADRLIAECAASDDDPRALADRLGLAQVTDAGALEGWADEVLAEPGAARSIEAVKAGKAQAVGPLVGAVMKKSGGQADARAVREILLAKIRGR